MTFLLRLIDSLESLVLDINGMLPFLRQPDEHDKTKLGLDRPFDLRHYTHLRSVHLELHRDYDDNCGRI